MEQLELDFNIPVQSDSDLIMNYWIATISCDDQLTMQAMTALENRGKYYYDRIN
jgi:hypothetical protein